MILIVGLGNPEKKYAKTRHNIGFRVIDELKSLDFVQNKDTILLKPETFMNDSGKATKAMISYYKIPLENLYVIHDDIDLPFGNIRVSKDSSSAGHKGVQSIIDELGTQNFTRIRIGIRPQKEVDTIKFVLQKFSKEEEKQLKEIIKKAVEQIKLLFDSCS
jgi:PTH1 family peptidyl-tRNA hydrolase